MKKITQKCSGNREPRSRCMFVTCWEKPIYDTLQMSYMIYGHEVCPQTGKDHWHTWIRFHNGKTQKAKLKYLPKGSWYVDQNGTDSECWAYCTKDNDYEEFGERPKQGKRTDLISIAEDISAGRSVDSIALENPEIYHQYGRTLNKLEDIRMRKVHRSEMTQGIWYYGETGSGKSHIAFENYSNETHYVLPNDKGWWDGYAQQDIVVINDFRGHIAYDLMLQLVDKWPMYVSRRGREPLPFTSKTVIVTSPLTPKEVYNNRDEKDSIKQLLRRFKVIKCHRI